MLLSATSGHLCAQKPVPVLESIFPAGGQAGQSIDVTISGEELEGASGLVFSTENYGFTIDTEPLPSTTSPENPNQFRVTIPEKAKAGRYGVHVRCARGLSSPRGFIVGTSPEVIESGVHSMRDQAMQVVVNTTVNGRAEESASDFYKIDLEAGETIRITCHSEALASRLSASLTIFGPDGTELDRDRDNSDRDAMVACTASSPGSYLIQVSDFTFRGGPAYTYRLEVAKGPQILFADPPAGEVGKTTTHLLYGRNLPGSDPSRRIYLGRRGSPDLDRLPRNLRVKHVHSPVHDPHKVLSTNGRHHRFKCHPHRHRYRSNDSGNGNRTRWGCPECSNPL